MVGRVVGEGRRDECVLSSFVEGRGGRLTVSFSEREAGAGSVCGRILLWVEIFGIEFRLAAVESFHV